MHASERVKGKSDLLHVLMIFCNFLLFLLKPRMQPVDLRLFLIALQLFFLDCLYQILRVGREFFNFATRI